MTETDWSTYDGPIWSATVAAQHATVSRTTLVRRATAGQIPGATKTADGWQFPALGLTIAGLIAPAPTAQQAEDEQPTVAGQDQTTTTAAAELAIVRAELATERARREGAEQLAEERAGRIADLQQALRALAPPPAAEPTDSRAADGDQDTTAERSTPQTTAQSDDFSTSTPPAAPRGLLARLRAAITGN